VRGEKMKNYLKNVVNAVREIDRKYAKPKIKLTRNVKIALLALRLYLLFLVIVLLYSFVIAVIHP
jgi:nitrate/nitrite-specific signal transduction histidine kinase